MPSIGRRQQVHRQLDRVETELNGFRRPQPANQYEDQFDIPEDVQAVIDKYGAKFAENNAALVYIKAPWKLPKHKHTDPNKDRPDTKTFMFNARNLALLAQSEADVAFIFKGVVEIRTLLIAFVKAGDDASSD